MSDYLSRLVERAASAPATVRPALPSLFEPVKAGGAFAAMSMSRGTEPISGTEHDSRSEAGVGSQSIHDRVASMQSIWTAAITMSTPPKNADETQPMPDVHGRMPVAGPAVRVVTAESQAVLEPPDKSPQQPPAAGPSPAQPGAATRPGGVFAAESDAIAEPSTESDHKAPPTPRMVRDLATARPAAPLLKPVVAAVPVEPIASGARARVGTAFAANHGVSPAPTIHVSIGRVEVRAIMPTAQVKAPPERSAPKLSLDDYLRSRRGGSA